MITFWCYFWERAALHLSFLTWLNWKLEYWIKIDLENLGGGGILEWISDGFCDDMNNNEDCDYDGGDCCGTLTNKEFCLECLCKSKL